MPLVQGLQGLRQISKVELPAQVDLVVSQLTGPVRDQGQVGVCWSMAMAAVADNHLRRSGSQALAAPMHLISQDAFRKLYQRDTAQTYAIETQWPYQPEEACQFSAAGRDDCGEHYRVVQGGWQQNPALVAKKQRADQTGFYRIVEPEFLQSTEQIASALAQGRAVYVDMNIQRDAWGWRAVQTGVVEHYTHGALKHAVTMVGYRTLSDGNIQFRMKNSWGQQWAEGGYAWINEATLAQHLENAFVFEVQPPGAGRFPSVAPPSIQPEQPGPKPEPSVNPSGQSSGAGGGQGCAAGQARDLLLNICLPACAEGRAPLGGFCPPPAGSASGHAACAANEAPDLVTGQCALRCPSGLPQAGGVCWLG